MTEYCFLNGEIMPVKDARVSILDIGIMRGLGVYEALTALRGKPFRFADHWNRLLDSAHLLNLNVPVTEEKAERVIRELLEKNGLSGTRANVKFILTGGSATASLEYDFEKPTFFIIVEKFEPLPAKLYSEGAKVVTYRHQRGFPEIKTTDYAMAVNLQNWRKDEGAVEILYTFDGEVLECATSNIFLVKDKTIITPAENILKGITRRVTLEIVEKAGYQVEERRVEESELKSADEVFLTSSFKDIIPVVRVDDMEVRNGKPGPITKDLMAKFEAVLI